MAVFDIVDDPTSDANRRHLAGRLASVQLRARELLSERGHADAVDTLSSLVITPAEAERLSGQDGSAWAVERWADVDSTTLSDP